MSSSSLLHRPGVLVRAVMRVGRRVISPTDLLRMYSVAATVLALVVLVSFLSENSSIPAVVGIDPSSRQLFVALMAALAACATNFARSGDMASSYGLGAIGLGHLLIAVALSPLPGNAALPAIGMWVSFAVGAAFVYISPMAPFHLNISANFLSRPESTQSLRRVQDDRMRAAYEGTIREAASREERQRLARDLHDAVKQQLFVIQTSAATTQVRFDSDPAGAREALEQVRASTRDAIAELEAMLDQLQSAPLEKTGLIEALRRQCEALELRTGAKVRFELGSLPPDGVLAPGAEQAALRIVQEALSNVARHARASNVGVHFGWTDGRLELTVRDDGSGFDSRTTVRGMGTRNMKARAEEFGGIFTLASTAARGTSLTVSFPRDPLVGLSQPLRLHCLVWGAMSLLWGGLIVVDLAYGGYPKGSFWMMFAFALVNFSMYLGASSRLELRHEATA